MWASRITFQHHQIFRLPWKMTEETWQTAEPSFTSRVATRVTLQHRQILRLPRNKRFQDMTEIFGNAETSFTMRARSENDPTMNPSVRNPQCNWGFFSRSPCASGFEKYNMWRSGYRSKISPLRLLECNFIKCCPWHENWMCIWTATLTKYCACHEKCAFLWDSTSLLRYHSLPLLVCYLYYSLTLLFFDSARLSLYSSLTMVFSYCTVLWLSTVLLLYDAGILPFCYSTSLFSTILWLYCSLLHYSLTLLFFYHSLIWF